MTDGQWANMIAAVTLGLGGVGAWANLKATIAALAARIEERHQENLRRFEALEEKK